MEAGTLQYDAQPVQIELSPAEQEAQEQPQGPVVVIVATSANSMDDHPTGAWLEEIAGPYYVFKESGCEVHVASIQGGEIPIDQGSLSEDFFTENCRRFEEE